MSVGWPVGRLHTKYDLSQLYFESVAQPQINWCHEDAAALLMHYFSFHREYSSQMIQHSARASLCWRQLSISIMNV